LDKSGDDDEDDENGEDDQDDEDSLGVSQGS